MSDFYDEPSVSGDSVGPTETIETVETMTADLESPPETLPEALPKPDEAKEEPAETENPAVARFNACRWHEKQENAPPYCANRDVLPFAGKNSFNPEAWCPDCKLYKVKRKVKKRSPDDWNNNY